jgi:hypothetical protein
MQSITILRPFVLLSHLDGIKVLSGIQTTYYIIQYNIPVKSKAVPLHAMEALGRRGGIAPTHS